MDVSYAQYIDKPGIIKGSATNSMIRLVKEDYKRRFDTLYMRESAMVVHKLYKEEKTKSYYVYVKMPSEKTVGFFYDVVIEFRPTAAQKLVFSDDLSKYNVKFFTNDPAFLFTYAYAFNKSNLIIDWLKPKLSRQALTERPVIRNPRSDTGYVKSLYFTYFFLQIRKLFSLNTSTWKTAIEINRRDILNEIPSFDVKMDNGRRMRKYQQDLKKQKEVESNKKKTMPYQREGIKRAGKIANKATSSEKAKITKVVSKVKNSKMVKRK